MKDTKINVRERASKRAKTGVVYEYYFTVKGTRYSKTGFQTEAKARKAGKDRYVEVMVSSENNHNKKKKYDPTLEEMCEYFKENAEKEFKINTCNFTYAVVRMLRNSDVWTKKASKITKEDIRPFITDEKYTYSTNSSTFFAIDRVFKFCIKHGLIQSNPCDRDEVRGNSKKVSKDVISEANYQRLLNEILKKKAFRYKSYAMAIEIGKYFGLRLCETFALKKDDFDFERKTLSVNKELIYCGVRKSDIHVKNYTKTGSSTDVLPIPDVFIDKLKKWFDYNPFDIVIADENGFYIYPLAFSEYIRRKSTSLGINFSYHILRHTYATTLIKNDVPIKVAQKLLRHSNVSTTLDIYTHITEEDKTKAVNLIFS